LARWRAYRSRGRRDSRRQQRNRRPFWSFGLEWPVGAWGLGLGKQQRIRIERRLRNERRIRIEQRTRIERRLRIERRIRIERRLRIERGRLELGPREQQRRSPRGRQFEFQRRTFGRRGHGMSTPLWFTADLVVYLDHVRFFNFVPQLPRRGEQRGQRVHVA
jgi:hypothetical protein